MCTAPPWPSWKKKARFYLQSRGISQREAEVMLSFGFINELLEALPDEAITLPPVAPCAGAALWP